MAFSHVPRSQATYMPAVIDDKAPLPPLTAREVCQVLREVTFERRPMVGAAGVPWGQIDNGFLLNPTGC